MKKIAAIIVVAAALAISQSACNKPDAGAIVEGVYKFAPTSSYVAYKYKIVADTFQLTKLYDNFFFNEPFPTVEIKKVSTVEATFKQTVPGDTFYFENVKLLLDGGGTLLNAPVKNGLYLKGSVIGYELKYDIVDTTNKKLIRVLGVEPPK
ncbi:MAG: hypothetical protein KF872_00845 [Chitinophagales bacterium]|nr:hypothetical protein [Chitinophagales bacterium]